MAKETVETKVVQVRFDNTKFSKNINTTIKQCEKLDKTLKFKGDKKGFQEVQKAVKNTELKELNKELDKTDSIINKISVSFMELAKIKLLSKAMDVVINKTNSMVKSLLGINNVIAGWQQYETQMTNVGGILNQVESKGYGLEDVADAMERLRWYTDETSFNFTTLSNGIRQFVIAGIDLNTAAEAAMGVTNLAGSAKVFDEYKVQSAMDAVSKAMQTGYMDTLKWTSLTNTAGIVTEEFSQKLLDQAVAQGKLVKSAAGQYKTKKGGKLVTTENIRSTLSEKWLTSDVLANVMDQYASASSAVEKFSGLMEYQTEDSLAEINAMFKESGVQFESFDEILSKLPEDVEDSTELSARQTGKLLENLGYQFDEISYKAFKSAQETTSFSQALTYVKKAISTQWANIFEKIFGDYETATGLWSDISDKFYSTFVHPFEVLTDTFDNWTDLAEGGAEDFRNVIRLIIDVIGRFKDAVGNGFRAVFGELNESILQKITLALERFFTNFKNNEALFKAITAITKIFASVLKIVGKVSSTIFKIQIKILTALEPIFEVVVDILDALADGLIWIIDYIDELGILDAVVGALSTVLEYLANSIRKVINWIKGKIDVQKVTEKIAKAVNKLRIAIEFLIDKIKSAINAIKEWWQENEIAQKVTEGFANALSKTKSFFSSFKKSTEEASEGLEELNERGEKSSKKLGWLEGFKAAFKNFGNAFVQIWNNLKQLIVSSGMIDTLKGFWNAIKELIVPIWQTIVGFFKGMAELVKTDPMAAVKKIMTAIFAIMGIIVILKIANIMRAVEWVLGELYATLKAFKKRILAERWKALAAALLMISASILILTFVIEKLGDINAKKAWKAIAMIFAFFVMIGAMLALMSSQKFQGSILGGFKTASMLLALGSGVSLLVLAFTKIMAAVTGMSISDVVKAGAIFAVIMGLMIGVFAVTLKKVEKKGLFKGEKVAGPGLLRLAKILLFVWGFLKIALWFINEVNKFEVSELVKAGVTIVAIFGIISAILLSFTHLRKSKSSSVNSSTSRVTFEFGSMFFVILAAVAILKMAAGLEWGEIARGSVTVLAIFGIISILSIALSFASRIAQKENVEVKSVRLGLSVVSIASSVLISVLAFKMISKMNLTSSEIWRVGGFILALYTIIGVIAIFLSAVSKVVNTTINKEGLNRNVVKTPIGSAILAITTSVLLTALAFKYLAGIDEEIFTVGLKRFKKIMTYMVVMTAIMSVASALAKNGAKSVIALLIALEVMVVSIIVLGALLTIDEKMETYVENGLGLILAVAISIAWFTFAIAHIAKTAEFGLKKSGSIAILLGSVIIIIAAIIAVAAITEKMPYSKLWNAVGVTAVAAVILIGLVLGFVGVAKLAKNIESSELVKLTIKILLITSCLSVIITAIYFLTKKDMQGQWKAVGIIGGIVGGLIGVLVLMTLIGRMANKVDKKSFIMLSIIMVLFTGCILTIVHALNAVSEIKDSKNIWRSLAIVGIIAGALVLAVTIMVLISWLANKADVSSMIMVNVIMAVFTASILGIVGAMILISTIAADEMFNKVAITVAVIAGALLIMVLSIIALAKTIKPDSLGNIITITAMIGVIALAILVISASFLILDSITDLGRIVGTMAAIMGIITGIILLLGLFAKIDIKDASFALVALALIAVVIFTISLAFKILSGIDNLGKIVGTIAAVMGIITGIALVLGAISATGVGAVVLWAGIAALAALASVLLVLAAAVAIFSIGVEKVTKSLIDLMNETTPEKCKNIASLGASLMSLAGGTIVNALADFGASLLGLGGAFIDFQASILDFASSGLQAFGDIIEGIGTAIKALGEEKEAKVMERKTKAYEDFANAMTELSNIDQNKINEVVKGILDFFESNIDSTKVESITKCLSSVILYFNTLAMVWKGYQNIFAQITNFLYYTIKILSNPGEVQFTFLDLLMSYLDKLKEAIDEIGNPTITPVLDLTKFNEGLGQINGALMQSKELLNDFVASSASRAYAGQVQPNPYMGGVSGSGSGYMVVNNNFNLNDSYSYGYDANRSIVNTIVGALSNAINFPANAIDKIANFFG